MVDFDIHIILKLLSLDLHFVMNIDQMVGFDLIDV